MVEAGWKPSRQEVERIAAELLSTLAYLQKQQVEPVHSVYHRNVALPTLQLFHPHLLLLHTHAMLHLA